MGKFIDMIKEKAKSTKDKFANTKKEAKDMAKSSRSSFLKSGSKRKFEEGASGTEIERKDDTWDEYKRNESMTSAKIKKHKPTAVKIHPDDQIITEPGQTWICTGEVKEEYRKCGYQNLFRWFLSICVYLKVISFEEDIFLNRLTKINFILFFNFKIKAWDVKNLFISNTISHTDISV